MNIHEYQGKQLLRDYGIPVPKGRVAFSPEEAIRTAERLGGKTQVLKAQIHAGGRGKAGGVKVAKSLEEVRAYSELLLGSKLVTHQTGPEGQRVTRLLVEEGCDIKHEYYFGMVLDRKNSRIAMMASSEGGVDIEEVAAKRPDKIVKEHVHPEIGLRVFQARRLAQAIGIPHGLVPQCVELFQRLYQLYVDNDCTIAEVNPLVLTQDGQLVALDVKMNFDGNALYRNPRIIDFRDLSEEDSKEVEASDYQLSYVALDGEIGCMVNGAGLAMATMDILKHYGGSPANFLDVGGSATADNVKEAFKIICSDPKVKGVFINIFGGIMKCDIIAKGVVEAAEELSLKVPLIVRLEGTNVDKGKGILKRSPLNIMTADSLADGAYKAVALIK